MKREGYFIEFTINGRPQTYLRYGKDILSVLALAIKILEREWPEGKIHVKSISEI